MNGELSGGGEGEDGWEMTCGNEVDQEAGENMGIRQ